MSSRDNSNAQAQADRSNSPLRKQLAKKLVGYYDQLNTSKDKDKSRNNSKERSKSRSQSKDGHRKPALGCSHRQTCLTIKVSQ
jgi:hypothetical protein